MPAAQAAMHGSCRWSGLHRLLEAQEAVRG